MNNGIGKKQLATFIGLQLTNLYGFNVYRNLKNPKEKNKKRLLYAAYALVMCVAIFYMGAMSFGYVHIGLADILPPYLIMLTSLIILMFSIFKAGDIIFQRNSYDIIASLPVRNSTIVISRFVRLYIENILLSVVIMLPAIIVYGVLVKPTWYFYAIGIIVVFFIPFLPITISVFIGAFIKAVSSRAKHKNLVSVLLSVSLVVLLMVGSMQLSVSAEDMNVKDIKNILNLALELIDSIYPPAIWLGNAMLAGNFMACLGCVCGGFLILAIVIGLVSMNYTWICDGIFSTNAKHNYQMEKLKSGNMLLALYKREFKRYFASSVYVTNTIIGPVMGLLFSGALLFVAPQKLEVMSAEFYAESGMMLNVKGSLPMALATVFSILPLTSVSISMEGKQWWIIKTLPISAKALLDSKLLMNLSVLAPFYGVAVIMVVIGQKVSFMELVWMVLVPLAAIMFSCVFGQTVNLRLAVFDWENEVSVVKQSASSFVGGIVPFFVMLVLTFGVMFVPAGYTNMVMLVLCLVLGVVTFVLYRKNSKVDLIGI